MASPEQSRHEPHLLSLADINRLVDASLTSRTPKSRQRASRDLVLRVNQQYEYPVYDVILRVQENLLEKNEKRAIIQSVSMDTALSFLDDFIFQTGDMQAHKGPRHIPLTQRLMDTIKKVEENDEAQRKTLDESLLYPNHADALENIKGIKIEWERKQKDFRVEFCLPPEEGEDPKEREKRIAADARWRHTLIDFVNKNESERNDAKYIDGIIDIMLKQPESPYAGSALTRRRVAGLTFLDIGGLPLPLEDEADRITEYVTGMSGKNPTGINESFIEQMFLGKNGKIEESKYAELLRRLFRWQSDICKKIYFPQDPATEKRTRNFLQSLTDTGLKIFLNSFLLHAVHPYTIDPDFSELTSLTEIDAPIFQEALQKKIDDIDEITILADEVAQRHMVETVLPRLEKRLSSFGVFDRVEEYFELIRGEEGARSFERLHLDFLKEHFTEHIGLGHLDAMTKSKEDIEQIAKEVWAGTPVHFLPVSEGYADIDFSSNAFASRLGIQGIMARTIMAPQDWTVQVIFKLKQKMHVIIGSVTKEGKLQLRVPLDQEMQGVYTALETLAVLTVSDLMRQDSDRTELPTGKKKTVDKDSGESDVVFPPQDQDRSRPVTVFTSLPRKQTYNQVIERIYKHRGFTPRRVDHHKQKLRGVREYETAVAAYNQAVENGAPEDEIEVWKELLAEARSNKYLPSQEKAQNTPSLFTLKTVVDPLTKKKETVETWVKEHTSPKQLGDKQESQHRLFVKLYAQPSALAALDPLGKLLFKE